MGLELLSQPGPATRLRPSVRLATTHLPHRRIITRSACRGLA